MANMIIQIVRCILTTSFSDGHSVINIDTWGAHIGATCPIKPTTICMSHSWTFFWKGCKCVWVTSLACKTVLYVGQRPARGEWVSSSVWSGAFRAFPLLFAAILSLEDNQGMFGPCLPNLLLARASGTQTPPLSRLLPFIFHFLFSTPPPPTC